MSRAKKLLAALLFVVLLAAVTAGFGWHMQHYQMVDFRFYPRDAKVLDLRGKNVTYSHYNKIRRQMPETEVLWSVPFQGRNFSSESKFLTITTLSDADVQALDYFPQLESIEAKTCRDYAQLLALQQRRPELDIQFVLVLGDRSMLPTAKNVNLSDVQPEELPFLALLQQLETVTITECKNPENVTALREYCQENGLEFRLEVGGSVVSGDAETVQISGITQEDLPMLQFLTKMKQLELETPKAPVESLLALQEAMPQVEVKWSQRVAGKLFDHTETLIDISNITVGDLDDIARAMTYFPDAQQLEMHFCGVENEEMAAFREAHREEYKVVWTVYLGPKLPTRTDTTSIMPARDGTSDFHDEEAYNMRYCEDVVAVDVGHLDVRSVEWAAFMPHLKYLILAWTGVRDLTPLSNCKELVWLELDNSPGGDTTPLVGCTALEDINIGKSGIDPAGLVQMPWLKNVWAIGRGDAAYKIAQACPDTRVVASGEKTVSGGWRYLPNYYKMRDALNMFYMDQ